MKLTNQAAIITGGGSGLGAATAKWLAQLGVKIALLDQDIEHAKTIAERIGAQAIECDVTNDENVKEAIAQVNQHYGSARILINCAGIAPSARIVGKQGPMPLKDFKQVIDVNLIGTFNCLRHAATAMYALEPLNETNERGVIINTASIAAYEGQLGQAAYSASKGGICAMTLPAAREFAPFGIRVMTIAPGLMETPMLETMPETVQEQLLKTTQFPKRLGKPDEFATLVQQIIENPLLNGSVIRLDGAIRLPSA